MFRSVELFLFITGNSGALDLINANDIWIELLII